MIWWIIACIATVFFVISIYSEGCCPNGGWHNWVYKKHECYGEVEPTSYMYGKYKYVKKYKKKYICKKCGQIKWEE